MGGALSSNCDTERDFVLRPSLADICHVRHVGTPTIVICRQSYVPRKAALLAYLRNVEDIPKAIPPVMNEVYR